MTNLLIPSLWHIAGSTPCEDIEHAGNSPQGGVCNFQTEEVSLTENFFTFGNSKKTNTAWYRGEGDWIWRQRTREYQGGSITSINKYGFGKYTLVAKVPQFRGSWPAWWFIDWTDKSQGGMGMPPEIDALEQMIKKCWDRYKISPGFIYGNSYANSTDFIKSVWRWKRWDKDFHTFVLIWKTDSLEVIYDNKSIWTITNHSIIPQGTMNMILNSGFGNWNPDEKNFNSLEIKSLSFEEI